MVAKEDLNNAETTNAKSTNLIQLNNIKNNFFEKGDKIILTLYVKDVNKDEALVEFNQNLVSLTFKTNDYNFLKQHNTDDSTTQFKWDIQLNGSIDASKCTYIINKSTMEICLCKHETSIAKWSNVIKPSLTIVTELDTNLPQSSKNVAITTSSNKINRSRSASSSLSPSPPQYRNRPQINIVNSNSNYGFVGLVNLGNTCYMNAALQCLINSTDLRDYFLETRQLFQRELNTNNSLGLNGKLAISFAMLLRQLWTSNSSSIAPNNLRELICTKYAHFRGYEQQDTHEFLCSLLSILHEDLNRVLKKPFYESALECEDETISKEFKIANESWERFLSRENSVIVDNFYGQFKSKLTCPECKKVSITFEPFNSLLVPIPSPKIAVKLIIMFSLARQRQPIRITVFMSGNETIQTLIDEIKTKFTDLKHSTLLAFVINNKKQELDTNDYGFEFDLNWSNIANNNGIPSLDASQHLIIYETETSNEIKEPIVELRIQQVCKFPIKNNSFDKCSFCQKPSEQTEEKSLRRCTRCYKSAYCNNDCQRNDWKQHGTTVCSLDNVGLPFVLTMRKSQLISIEQFRKSIIQMSCHSVEIENLDENNFELELLNTEANNKLKIVELNDLMEMLESTNKMHLVLKIQLKWKNIKNFKVKTNLNKINDLSLSNESLVLNLNDCLKLFTQPERLTTDNPWYCSNCKKHQEATKQMNLWKLPKYLIITLKRFQASKASDHYQGYLNPNLNYLLQNRVVYNKINNFIEFPLRNLDMSKYLTQSDQNDHSYDLCGVINHLGQSLYLGHYTSFARSHDKLDSSNDELGWRLFDDSHVSSVKTEDQIVTRDAYVLFYRQRTMNLTKLKTQLETVVTSESENELNSDESEQFNSANQSSDDNFDCDDKTNSNYTNLNDLD